MPIQLVLNLRITMQSVTPLILFIQHIQDTTFTKYNQLNQNLTYIHNHKRVTKKKEKIEQIRKSPYHTQAQTFPMTTF